MLGIYDCFGYGPGYDVYFEDRYQLIRNAGFDCVMLWWSDKFGRGTGYKKDVAYARNAGLHIENIHAPVHEQNCISQDNQHGTNVFESYMQCVKDCSLYDIPTLVLHLPNDTYPINKLGMNRFHRLVAYAEDHHVNVAFENLDNIKNLSFILDTIHSKFTGFCYDSCHHINYAPEHDLLKKYGPRLIALHLQDNGGKHNQHQLPFDGSLIWEDLMKKIASTGYTGSTTLEPMNWDYEDLTIQQFLDRAYQRAKKLDDMRV